MHCPDLNSPNFLWDYPKRVVYVNKPETLEQLKENITKEIREMDPETQPPWNTFCVELKIDTIQKIFS